MKKTQIPTKDVNPDNTSPKGFTKYLAATIGVFSGSTVRNAKEELNKALKSNEESSKKLQEALANSKQSKRLIEEILKESRDCRSQTEEVLKETKRNFTS